MIKWHWKKSIAGKGLFAVVSVALFASLAMQQAVAANSSATDQKIIHYVRERFGVPDNIELTVAPFQNSQFDGFYKATIYVQKGKQKRTQDALITKDLRYMVIGDVFVASPTVQHNLSANASATDQKIVDYVRTKFHVPDTVKLTVGPFRHSPYKGFYQATIYGRQGEHKSSTEAFLTADGRYAIIGSLFDLNVNPKKTIESVINLNNQPTVGPADAPVTIVEYADLECPMCAETQKFIHHDLIPKYGNKIRVVFKEFPLVQIHDWALTAAIANECAYKLNPADYFKYRSTIFAGQDMINAANVRSLLLDFGERSGLNRVKLAECIDSKATLPRVEADMREARKLEITETPTLFINGAPVVGYQRDRIYQLINQDLKQQSASK